MRQHGLHHAFRLAAQEAIDVDPRACHVERGGERRPTMRRGERVYRHAERLAMRRPSSVGEPHRVFHRGRACPVATFSDASRAVAWLAALSCVRECSERIKRFANGVRRGFGSPASCHGPVPFVAEFRTVAIGSSTRAAWRGCPGRAPVRTSRYRQPSPTGPPTDRSGPSRPPLHAG